MCSVAGPLTPGGDAPAGRHLSQHLLISEASALSVTKAGPPPPGTRLCSRRLGRQPRFQAARERSPREITERLERAAGLCAGFKKKKGDSAAPDQREASPLGLALGQALLFYLHSL